MKRFLYSILFAILAFWNSASGSGDGSETKLMTFGGGGIVKMLYDARQRPQAVYVNGKVHLVYNGNGRARESKNSKRKAESVPMAVTYDPSTGSLSEPVVLSAKYSSDHHDGPVIWADRRDRLHVFYGWHHDLGTHMVTKTPGGIGSKRNDWREAPAPAPKMSYQWNRRIYEGKQLVFYRTDGHYSSWTYRISSDDGETWEGPKNDVLDLDLHLGMDTDWSTHTAKEVSADGRFLHLGFIAYDDYKRPRLPEELASGKLDERRLQNPLYDNRVPSNYKYNLYYVKVDLKTHDVVNDRGEVLQTPIDRATANEKCLIWDTEGRGGGIIPTIRVDATDSVSFLHNISDTEHELSLSYHYVRQEKGQWEHSRITHSNHHWNSGYIAEDPNGDLRAYLLAGEGYLNVRGDMDRYGGGAIEEWRSTNGGETWSWSRDITPDRAQYPGWKYNNIQAVRKPDGIVVDGMLIFYGWQDPETPTARAFLMELD